MNNVKQKYTALIRKSQREGSSSVPQLQLCFQILSVAADIDSDCASRLSQYNLSEGRFVLLFLLHDHNKGLSPHELADLAGVTRATISGLLDGLEKSGLVLRHKGEQDKRSITVRLTAEGTCLISGLFIKHAQWIKTLFDGFSKKECGLLYQLLYRVWLNTDAGKKAGDIANAKCLPKSC